MLDSRGGCGTVEGCVGQQQGVWNSRGVCGTVEGCVEQ